MLNKLKAMWNILIGKPVMCNMKFDVIKRGIDISDSPKAVITGNVIRP